MRFWKATPFVNARMGWAVALLAWAVSAAPAAVAEPPDHRIHLRTGPIDTRVEVTEWAGWQRSAPCGVRWVMQLDSPITPERRRELADLGIELADYLPDNAYVVRVNSGAGMRSAPPGFVRWMGRYRDDWKVAPEIGTVPFRTPYRQELAAQGLQQLIVILFEGEGPDAAADQATARGAQVLLGHDAGGRGVLEVLMPTGLATDLAAIEAVQWIEEASEATLRNDTNRWVVQSNNAGQTPVWNHGIHGEGQIGGLLDGPVRLAHCAFVDPLVAEAGPTHRKLVAYRGVSGSNAHGTHVAGTFAGDEPPYGVWNNVDGIAFAARLSFGDNDPVFYNPSTTYAAFMDAHNDGARVHSNSWGDDGTKDYILRCQQIDQFMWDNEDDLILFAVTNLADLRAPENAKNLLAVGASRDAPNQGERCTAGAGPTIDGRRRPEVFAPGCGTQSANADASTCGLASIMTGTSMACPVVAGAALLVRQYFTEGFYPTGVATPANARTPSGALMKAVLINGSVDMTGIAGYPSDQEGWGRLLLDNSLYFPGDAAKLYVEDVRNINGLSTGQYRVFGFQVTGSSVPLRVTLVWTDYPGTVGVESAKVNDLDLVVTGPGGVMYRGNVFSGGQSIAGGFRDPKNNTEQVHRVSPAVGNYTVSVQGTAVAQGIQGFALVVTGDGVGPVTFDCNTNGVSDVQDIDGATSQDCQHNGVPDECEGVLDCNGNGTLDVCESFADCNANGLPDACENLSDCNHNSTPDVCETLADCNNNGVPDVCETLADCNNNGVPDVCESLADCNNNGVPDVCESLADCNNNGTPDVCEALADCNNNGTPDVCEALADCDNSGVPDVCESLADCNNNGTPDVCEGLPDCNNNGVGDPCDIAAGTSTDCDGTGVPDECESPVDLLDENFETGLPANWSASGLWHVTNQCPYATPCNPTHWAYFGVNEFCNFNLGATATGVLTAPSFYLSAGMTSSLTYCSIYEGEGGDSGVSGNDWAWVTVNGLEVDDVSQGGSQSAWTTRQVDLTPFAGQTVTIRWHFDSVDGDTNGGLGWQIDAVKVTGGGITWDCNNNQVYDACDIAEGTSADCNDNSTPDECETFSFGDYDDDSDVDLADFRSLVGCLAGPTAPPSPGRAQCSETCRRVFDSNADNHVDLDDFAAFATIMANP